MKAIDVLKLIDQGKLRKLEEKATDGAIYDEAVRLGDKAPRCITKDILATRRKYEAKYKSFPIFETEDHTKWLMSPYYAIQYRSGDFIWLPAEKEKPFLYKTDTIEWGAEETDFDEKGVCYEGEWFATVLIDEIWNLLGGVLCWGVQSGNIKDHKMLVMESEIGTAWLCPFVKEK